MLVFVMSSAHRAENPRVARIPYLNAIASLKKKKYEQIENKSNFMNECTICLEHY